MEKEVGEQKKNAKQTDLKSPLSGTKQLEIKCRELEQENQELKEKLNSTEVNLSQFVKEMTEMLESHELSTNIGSDENLTFDNSNQQ